MKIVGICVYIAYVYNINSLIQVSAIASAALGYPRVLNRALADCGAAPRHFPMRPMFFALWCLKRVLLMGLQPEGLTCGQLSVAMLLAGPQKP